MNIGMHVIHPAHSDNPSSASNLEALEILEMIDKVQRESLAPSSSIRETKHEVNDDGNWLRVSVRGHGYKGVGEGRTEQGNAENSLSGRSE